MAECAVNVDCLLARRKAHLVAAPSSSNLRDFYGYKDWRCATLCRVHPVLHPRENGGLVRPATRPTLREIPGSHGKDRVIACTSGRSARW